MLWGAVGWVGGGGCVIQSPTGSGPKPCKKTRSEICSLRPSPMEPPWAQPNGTSLGSAQGPPPSPWAEPRGELERLKKCATRLKRVKTGSNMC